MIQPSVLEYTLLQKISVRTAKLNDSNELYDLGSGTIFASGKKYYVLTAGHCVHGVDKFHLLIEYYDGVCFQETKVLEIITCKYDEKARDDYAVLEIEAPKTDIDYSSIIKRLDISISEDNYIMLSYPPEARNGRFFMVKKNLDDFWEVQVPVNFATEDFKDVIEGSSGSGIVTYRHNRFYYVGLVTSTRNSVGTYNDIRTMTPSVFDGIIPTDTKDNEFFDTLKSWEEWFDNKNNLERRDAIKKLNVEWLENLTNKMQVLYPRGSEDKVDSFIKYFLKGLEVINKILLSNPSFVNELNKLNDKFFDRLLETHKEDFESSEGAYQDLQHIINEIKRSIEQKFPEDKDGIITNDYAYYRVAERLLNCHLKYYKYD